MQILEFNSRTDSAMQTPAWVGEEVRKRRAMGGHLRAALDDFILRRRGIDSFSRIVDAWLPPADELILYFSRQIATVSLENMAVERLAAWLSRQTPARAETVEMKNDCWAANGYKKSLTALPLITDACDGRLHVRAVKTIPTEMRRHINMRPVLSSIPAKIDLKKWGIAYQGMLPGLHRTLRQAAGCRDAAYDTTSLWTECLRATTQPPESVYVESGGHAARRAWTRDVLGRCRPPASWYYLLYLCFFVTGDRALVASTIEEDDEEIRTLFTQNIALIERETGVAPLILWTPHYSSRLLRTTREPLDFNEIHPGVFKGGWTERLTLPAHDATCHEAADDYLHQLATMPLT